MRTLAGYISHAIEEFPVDPKTIYEMVVAGNSTMRDLFFRQNVHSIGQNPTVPSLKWNWRRQAHDDQPDVQTGQRSLLAATSQGARLRRAHHQRPRRRRRGGVHAGRGSGAMKTA
jgi:hypothetical protein